MACTVCRYCGMWGGCVYKYVYTIINKLSIGILQGQMWFVITAHLTGRNYSVNVIEQLTTVRSKFSNVEILAVYMVSVAWFKKIFI